MTHCSLFKEAAQRIVQSAQASQNNGLATLRSSAHELPPTQTVRMSGSTFTPDALSASPDKSEVKTG
jgi:hypothetical protein